MKQRGVALAVVILALVVVSLLVAVAFHQGHLEQRAGRNTLYAAQAAGAAEAGISLVLGNWEAMPQLAALAVGAKAALPAVALSERVAYRTTVLRLTDGLYLLRGTGTRTDALNSVLAERAVVTVVRVDGPVVAPLAQRSWAQVF